MTIAQLSTYANAAMPYAKTVIAVLAISLLGMVLNDYRKGHTSKRALINDAIGAIAAVLAAVAIWRS